MGEKSQGKEEVILALVLLSHAETSGDETDLPLGLAIMRRKGSIRHRFGDRRGLRRVFLES